MAASMDSEIRDGENYKSSSASDNVEMDSSEGTKPAIDNAALESMLAHIASGEATVKSQQRGEEEPSLDEKMAILRTLLDRRPAVFLERFHACLRAGDLGLFGRHAANYEVQFYLGQARERLLARRPRTGIRNRRYEALKELEREGAYFADQAMKDRDPLMFEEYVGQYMTAEERRGLLKPIDPSDVRLSNILMTFLDEQETKQLYRRQKEAEDDAMEEEEDEEDEEDGEDEEEEREEDDRDDDGATKPSSSCQPRADRPSGGRQSGGSEWEPTPASAAERALMRQEFLHHMHLRFLSGQEKDFDYAAVDGNAEYDSLALRAQDEEEHYFDAEEEETWSQGEASGRPGASGEEAGQEEEEVDYCDLDVVAMEKAFRESKHDHTDTPSPAEESATEQPTHPT